MRGPWLGRLVGASLVLCGGWPANAAQTLEHIPGAEIRYGEIANPNGVRQRTIVTRPAGATAPMPTVFFVPWLSCDSVALPPGPRGGIEQLLYRIAGESGWALFRVEKPGMGGSGGVCADTDFETELAGYRAAFDDRAPRSLGRSPAHRGHGSELFRSVPAGSGGRCAGGRLRLHQQLDAHVVRAPDRVRTPAARADADGSAGSRAACPAAGAALCIDPGAGENAQAGDCGAARPRRGMDRRARAAVRTPDSFHAAAAAAGAGSNLAAGGQADPGHLGRGRHRHAPAGPRAPREPDQPPPSRRGEARHVPGNGSRDVRPNRERRAGAAGRRVRRGRGVPAVAAETYEPKPEPRSAFLAFRAFRGRPASRPRGNGKLSRGGS